MSSSDKLSIDTVIAQVLVEEKSRQTSNGQSVLFAKGPNQKTKSKQKDKKKKEKCTYCSIPGHEEKDCRKKKKAVEEATKSSGTTDKPKDKPDLSAKVARVSLDNTSPIQLFMVHEPGSQSASNWIVDSGASANMTCQCNIYVSYRTLNPPECVIIGDGQSIDAIGIGHMQIEVHIGDGNYRCTILQDVYYMPNLSANLLSVPRLMKQGLEVTFNGSTCKILANGKVAALARKQNSLYILETLP